MFYSFVLVGESIQLAPDKYLVKPPQKADQTEYDSVINMNCEQTIIYDPNKCYPGYLITYN